MIGFMEDFLNNTLCRLTGASSVQSIESLQELWNGYGRILRVCLNDCDFESVVVKHITPSNQHGSHPRGWHSTRSRQRKARSYEIEVAWYRDYQRDFPGGSPIPKCLGIQSSEGGFCIVLEDLQTLGFSNTLETASFSQMIPCLRWLAQFHAGFMHRKPEKLWPTGTYWHLDTRPDELKALKDLELAECAREIDQSLRTSTYQTFVHGDAKLANFCFKRDFSQVAAVDFQYVGGGCGMKDLSYFVGSCLNGDQSEALEETILDIYFEELAQALKGTSIDRSEVENEWRPLYHVAWADFHRFLKGWCPDHWKINRYTEKLVRKTVEKILASK